MSRRLHSKSHTTGLLLIVAVGVLVGYGGFRFLNTATDPFRTLTSLDIGSYYENANSLRGNTYKLRGVIKNSLAWSSTDGRIISINALSADNKETDPIAVLIPAEFNSTNLQRGQQFHFQVEVGDHGLLIVRDLKKL
ncbi:MAG: hypothetical protein NZM04_10215 [Methylacidiphilales bacterium]|nr:hypothetical protein [Candidatus Methylacidiphilales bacterium]MDW8349755.1 hypothetical protein [Verrucomicrobiae bacterium]